MTRKSIIKPSRVSVSRSYAVALASSLPQNRVIPHVIIDGRALVVSNQNFARELAHQLYEKYHVPKVIVCGGPNTFMEDFQKASQDISPENVCEFLTPEEANQRKLMV